MSTENRYTSAEKKTRMWGILPERFRRVRRSKSIRPIFLFIASLAMVATVLGVIGLVMPVESVQATPGTGTSLENLGRATLGPFRIIQEAEPDPLSADTTDVTMHKVTMDVDGNSGWHIHPGLTFGIIAQGQVEFTRFTKGGCVKQAFGPGEGFVEPVNEVHIARNIGDEPLVMYLTRLNITAGGATTDPSPAEPDCNLASGGSATTGVTARAFLPPVYLGPEEEELDRVVDTKNAPNYNLQRSTDSFQELYPYGTLIEEQMPEGTVPTKETTSRGEVVQIFGEDVVVTLGYKVLAAKLDHYQADGSLTSRDLERLDQDIDMLMIAAAEKSSEARAAYNRGIDRLEGEIASLLAEASRNPSANPSQLDRQVQRLDDQIDMLRQAAMERQ